MLTDEQLRDFARDGYIVVRGAVGEELLLAVDEEIDTTMAADPPAADTRGPHFYFLPPARLPAADAALRESGGLRTAEELVAPHVLVHGLNHIQIALNIPEFSHRPGGPHIDGHRPEQTEPRSFTMLAALYLVDESEEDSGNLWVWPGSHLVHQQLFTERGVGALLPVGGQPTLLDPAVTWAEPTPVLAHRGDLLLAHFLLGHNTGATSQTVFVVLSTTASVPTGTRRAGLRHSSTCSPSMTPCAGVSKATGEGNRWPAGVHVGHGKITRSH